MKKNIIIFILAVILLFTPFVVVATSIFATPCQYDETFLGELKDKHARLSSINEEKIVLIGGSNLAFGVDSAKLQNYVGKPVVNYGLYATIGTKAMLDLSRSYIKNGDIVVICPETEAQTYSLYYNAHSLWQAMDCDLSILKDVGFSNYGKIIAAMPEFAAEKLRFIRNNSKPSPTGIYAEASFNEYGDISVERPFNEMPANYDTSMPITLDTDLLDAEFVDYLNEYAAYCEKQGATVYFSFSPINADAVTSSEEDISAFYSALKEELNFPVLSDINDYILDSAYFYDTNFHLNSTGALQRTSLLADDLLRILNKDGTVETEKYDPPVRPDNYFSQNIGEDENAKYFVYEEIEGGLAIVGLSEEGKLETSLTIPAAADGKAVLMISDNAFAGSSVLERVVIGKNACVKSFSQGALNNCPTLKVIEIHLDPSALPIDRETIKNKPADCFIYIPAEKYSDFATDYFWSSMMAYVKIIGQ